MDLYVRLSNKHRHRQTLWRPAEMLLYLFVPMFALLRIRTMSHRMKCFLFVRLQKSFALQSHKRNSIIFERFRSSIQRRVVFFIFDCIFEAKQKKSNCSMAKLPMWMRNNYATAIEWGESSENADDEKSFNFLDEHNGTNWLLERHNHFAKEAPAKKRWKTSFEEAKNWEENSHEHSFICRYDCVGSTISHCWKIALNCDAYLFYFASFFFSIFHFQYVWCRVEL